MWSPLPAQVPPDLPEDAVEQGPVGLLSSIVPGDRAVSVGLATTGWPGGGRARPLLSFSGPRGALAAPRGLGARDGCLPLRTPSTLPGPSESPVLLAPLPGRELALSTTPGSHSLDRGLPGVWAALPPHRFCGHVGRADGAQRPSTREHPWFSGTIELLNAPLPWELIAWDGALRGIRVSEAGSSRP